jgi:hypothetical protein
MFLTDYTKLTGDELKNVVGLHIQKTKYMIYKDAVNTLKLNYQDTYNKQENNLIFHLKIEDMPLKDFEIVMFVLDNVIVSNDYKDWEIHIMNELKIPFNQRNVKIKTKNLPRLKYIDGKDKENLNLNKEINEDTCDLIDSRIVDGKQCDFIQQFVSDFQNKTKFQPLYMEINNTNTLTNSKSVRQKTSNNLPLRELKNVDFFEWSCPKFI